MRISLIEILISLFILSLFLLGFDAMQIVALREAKSAYYFSVAAQQIEGMMERLIAVKGKNMQDQLMIWNNQNHDVLPQGKGSVTGIYPHFTLAIFWGNVKKESCDKNIIGVSGCLHLSISI